VPLTIIQARAIGLMTMIDAGKQDHKIIAVATEDPEFNTYHEANEMASHRLLMLRRFFQDYKQLEGKAVEVDEILPSAKAFPIITTRCTATASNAAKASRNSKAANSNRHLAGYPACLRPAQPRPRPTQNCQQDSGAGAAYSAPFPTTPGKRSRHHGLPRLQPTPSGTRHVLHYAVDAIFAGNGREGRGIGSSSTGILLAVLRRSRPRLCGPEAGGIACKMPVAIGRLGVP